MNRMQSPRRPAAHLAMRGAPLQAPPGALAIPHQRVGSGGDGPGLEDLVARRIVVAIGLLLALAFAVDRVLGAHDFAAFGKDKLVTLPATYLVFGFAGVLPAAARSKESPPAWVTLPALGILIGSVGLIVFPWMPNAKLDIAQGSLLFLGFAYLGWLGTQAVIWRAQSRRRLMFLLIAGGLLAGLLRFQGVTPFNALCTPSFFAVVVLTVRVPGRRLLFGALSVVLGVLAVKNIHPDPTVQTSVATQAQFVICAGAVALLLFPPRMRAAVIAVGVCVGTWIFTVRGGFALLSGHYESTDVTISHRSYEAAQVLGLLGKSPWAMLFGYGPGGTVDLRWSPDAATLEWSGRNLAAVGSVHLLPAHVLLKMGALGLAWLVVLLVASWRVSVSCLESDSELSTFRLVVLMFLLAGLVDSFPAATFLLSNPLVPLLLGILWATRPGKPHPFGRNG